MFTQIRCHLSYSIDEKSLMNSNPFNAHCCRWETTWISFFPTQNQIARNLEMNLNREKFSRTSSLFHSRGRGGWAKVPARPIVILASYLVVFSIFTLRNRCCDDVTWLCACAVFMINSLMWCPSKISHPYIVSKTKKEFQNTISLVGNLQARETTK